MPQEISRREVVKAAGAVALGVAVAGAWSGTATAAPPADAAPAADAAATVEPTTLFPWIGI
jgi:hypothetical protein